MKISSNVPTIRPADAKAPAAPASQPQTAAKPAAPRSTDSVQFSSAGMALSGADAKGSLTPERTAEIRQRLLSGAYHSAEMAGEVAKRMLSSGDV